MYRRVRRLRLACAREEHARHGRVLLEDALRTATLNDDGRLIIVRRLDLGRIPLRASATQWSRQLEESFRRSPVAPVRFDAPAASDADAIYFENRTEPWIALAERVAQGRPASEWFWPLALPGWTSRQDPGAALRLALRTLARQDGLTLTLQLAQRLRAHHALEPLLRVVSAEDLTPLLTELGTLSAAPSNIPSPSPLSPAILAPLTSGEREAVERWGASDVRTHWLAALHLIAAARSRSIVFPVTPPPALRLQLIEHWLRTASAQFTETSTRTSATVAPSRPDSPTRSDSTDPKLAPEEISQTLPTERAFTQAGGLFFLLPLLARAGLPPHLETLSADEAAVLPWQLLRLGLRHARTPDDDPLVLALREFPPSGQPLGPWLIAAHRQARRLSGLSLRQLIARPALVTLSATHVDLFFRPGDADIRLRRAALDVDPGWVPWLGRVIAFHFNREE
jgi:hypothetical protein